MPQDPDDNKIVLYLLGALPQAETERLDELSLTDPSFADRLTAAENDLVDAYARGELSADKLQALKSYYLASPRRLDKVRFAAALIEFAASPAAAGPRDRRAAGQESAVTGRTILPGKRWRGWFAAPQLRWALAAGGMGVLIAAGYLAIENLRLHGRIAQSQREQAELAQREKDLERQIDDDRSEDAKTVAELARVRERLAQLEQQAAGAQHVGPETGGRGQQVVAFTLAAPTRGATPIRTLVLPAKAGFVVLALELESVEFTEYRATLKSPAANQIIWQSARIKPVSAGQNKAVSIKLRADLLKPGTYDAELAGIRKGGTAETIGSYPFKVVISSTRSTS